MAFVWYSKRSGQRARGGGCIGCIPIPIGCAAGAAALVMLIAVLFA